MPEDEELEELQVVLDEALRRAIRVKSKLLVHIIEMARLELEQSKMERIEVHCPMH